MSLVLVVAAAATVAGAVLALSTRDARTALGGLALVILASPLVADPLPGIVPLTARIVGAILAIELLWIAVRGADVAPGEGGGEVGGRVGAEVGGNGRGDSRAAARRPGPRKTPTIDARVEALAAGAGLAAGFLIALRYEAAGVPMAWGAPIILGTTTSLLTVGVTPLLVSRDTLRLGTGAIVVLVGAMLLGGVTGGVVSPLGSLVAAGLVIAAAAAVAAVMLNALSAAGGLGFDDALAVETEAEPVDGPSDASRARPRSQPVDEDRREGHRVGQGETRRTPVR